MMRWNNFRSSIIFLGFVLFLTQMMLADSYPEELQKQPDSIADIVSDPSSFIGKDVVIQGTIQIECPAGCWFIVEDERASVYVDILPSNFVIPQEAGSSVRVFGAVVEKDGEAMVIGKMVMIDEKLFK